MKRTIENVMAEAIRSGHTMKMKNTQVVQTETETKVLLHGNCIFKKNKVTGKVFYDDCGWRTKTTASRLNCLGCNYSYSKYADNSAMLRKWL